MAFFLFANCNFIPDHYEDWQAAYDKLAQYVSANEPTTKTYYFGIPMDYADNISGTTSMFAFEVYGKRELLDAGFVDEWKRIVNVEQDLYETHLGSPAMAKFLETIPAYTTTDLDLNHYRAVGGFLDRDGTKKECERMLDQRIGCKSPEEREAVLKNLQELASEVQTTEKSKPSGVLTFQVFACLDNDTSARIYSRFESKADMEKFLRRSDVASFWQKSKDKIASMESKQYVPNRKGWLHRNGDTLETGKPI